MATITRRGILAKIPAKTVLASADAITGTVDGTQYLDCTGLLRVLIVQDNVGTAGTAGIDVIEVSTDGGTTWTTDALSANPTLMTLASDEQTGTILASSALNAAGVEPTTAAVFKMGPFEGPVKIRCARGGSGAGGTAWVTGAPAVYAISIGA